MEADLLKYYKLISSVKAKINKYLIINYGKKYEFALFTFDLHSGKCTSICPSIKEITGYNHEEYLSKGLIYLRKIIHPLDYSDFIAEILIYINFEKDRSINDPVNNHLRFFSCRIKHKDGYWVEMKTLFLYVNNLQNILLGLVKKAEKPIKNNKFNHNISSREREVLQLIGNGEPSKVIADKLNISETTVITHRKNMIQKFNVKNTAELIKEAVKDKIID